MVVDARLYTDDARVEVPCLEPDAVPADLFLPRGIAVVGASTDPRKVGYAALRNLLSFKGALYPVNPKRDQVLGRQAYPSLSAVPGPVEMAVIAVPAELVPGVIAEAGTAGVRLAVILSAGFRESGEAGRLLEEQVMANARAAGIRVVGPNCLGIMLPPYRDQHDLRPGLAEARQYRVHLPVRGRDHHGRGLVPPRGDRLLGRDLGRQPVQSHLPGLSQVRRAGLEHQVDHHVRRGDPGRVRLPQGRATGDGAEAGDRAQVGVVDPGTRDRLLAYRLAGRGLRGLPRRVRAGRRDRGRVVLGRVPDCRAARVRGVPAGPPGGRGDERGRASPSSRPTTPRSGA